MKCATDVTNMVRTMSTLRLILIAALVGTISGCDLFGGDGGSDDPYIPEAPPEAPPEKPPASPPIDNPPIDNPQSIHQPPIVDAPIGDPAVTRSYSLNALGLSDAAHAGEGHAVSALNEAGEVVGRTGSTPWIHSGGITREIMVSDIP